MNPQAPRTAQELINEYGRIEREKGTRAAWRWVQDLSREDWWVLMEAKRTGLKPQ